MQLRNSLSRPFAYCATVSFIGLMLPAHAQTVRSRSDNLPPVTVTAPSEAKQKRATQMARRDLHRATARRISRVPRMGGTDAGLGAGLAASGLIPGRGE